MSLIDRADREKDLEKEYGRCPICGVILYYAHDEKCPRRFRLGDQVEARNVYDAPDFPKPPVVGEKLRGIVTEIEEGKEYSITIEIKEFDPAFSLWSFRPEELTLLKE
ncbi:MAG: hypothetical protein J5I35_07625 [Methanothrix harundinacea]|nr:hypothetical protein [Methanothrix harundinacea]